MSEELEIGEPTSEVEDVLEPSTDESTQNPEPSDSDNDGSEQPDADATADQDDEPDYLPSEQAKVFPVEELAKYAKRYGYTLEEIQADPRLQQSLKDKINSDIYLDRLKAEQAEEETDEEPNLEAAPVKQEPTLAPAEQRAQYMKQLDAYADQFVDADIAKEFDSEFVKAYSDESLKPEVRAQMITKTFTKFGLNLLRTVAPQLIEEVLMGDNGGQARILDMAERANPTLMFQNQWEKVRNAAEKDGTKPYAELPAYNTKEFHAWATKAAAKIPNFENMVITGKDNKPLPPREQAAAKYRMLAQLASGEKVDTASLSRVAEKVQDKLKAQSRTRANGQLGAGQSKGSLKPGRDDSFLESIKRYNASQNSSSVK